MDISDNIRLDLILWGRGEISWDERQWIYLLWIVVKLSLG